MAFVANVKTSFITDTIRRALDSAGLTRSPGLGSEIRSIIDRALAAAGLHAPSTRSPPAGNEPVHHPRQRGTSVETAGDFLSLTHTSAHGSRDYRLYVPTSYDGRPMPVVVMLHGCRQNPEDFAAGTRMNEHAERHGFLVAYPAQTARANGSNCWNWFVPAHQTRDGAEPALIAGIVQDIAKTHAVLPGKVFAAGLSAGAAMALILGRAYPEVFAAVAAHSGLPVGAAHDVESAFAAMHGYASERADAHGDAPPVRTIVFHGDADSTVTVRNGAAIVEQAVTAFEQAGGRLQRLVRLDAEYHGKKCTTTEFTDASGTSVVEQWVVHGGAHAWSGGSSAGSFTVASGPDASDEIVRFFLEP